MKKDDRLKYLGFLGFLAFLEEGKGYLANLIN